MNPAPTAMEITTRSARRNINDLPSEIQRMIFERVVGYLGELHNNFHIEDRFSCVAFKNLSSVYRVCQLWQRVARSDQSLWCRIDLTYPTAALACLQLCGSSRPLHLRGSLRSSSLGNTPVLSSSLVQSLRSHLHQIETAHIYYEVHQLRLDDFHTFLSFLGSGTTQPVLPNLRKLSLASTRGPVGIPLPNEAILSLLRHPSLRALCLGNFVLGAGIRAPMPSLTSLTLCYSTLNRHTLWFIYTALHGLPALEELFVQSFPWGWRDTLDPIVVLTSLKGSPIPLPSLKRVCLAHLTPAFASALYDVLDAPLLRGPTIRLGWLPAMELFLSWQKYRCVQQLQQCRCDLAFLIHAPPLGMAVRGKSRMEIKRKWLSKLAIFSVHKRLPGCVCATLLIENLPNTTELGHYSPLLHAWRNPPLLPRIRYLVISLLTFSHNPADSGWRTLLLSLWWLEGMKLLDVDVASPVIHALKNAFAYSRSIGACASGMVPFMTELQVEFKSRNIAPDGAGSHSHPGYEPFAGSNEPTRQDAPNVSHPQNGQNSLLIQETHPQAQSLSEAYDLSWLIDIVSNQNSIQRVNFYNMPLQLRGESVWIKQYEDLESILRPRRAEGYLDGCRCGQCADTEVRLGGVGPFEEAEDEFEQLLFNGDE